MLSWAGSWSAKPQAGNGSVVLLFLCSDLQDEATGGAFIGAAGGKHKSIGKRILVFFWQNAGQENLM